MSGEVPADRQPGWVASDEAPGLVGEWRLGQSGSMSDLIDFTGPARQVSALVAGTSDDQLSRPTPIGLTVAQLLGHVHDLTVAFREAATKEASSVAASAPAPADSELPDGWRDVIPARLDELARAWREPSAWEGMTRAGGLDMPVRSQRPSRSTSSSSTAGTSQRRRGSPSRPTVRRSRRPRASAPRSRTTQRRAMGSSVRESLWQKAPRSSTACWGSPGGTLHGGPTELRPRPAVSPPRQRCSSAEVSPGVRRGRTALA